MNRRTASLSAVVSLVAWSVTSAASDGNRRENLYMLGSIIGEQDVYISASATAAPDRA